MSNVESVSSRRWVAGACLALAGVVATACADPVANPTAPADGLAAARAAKPPDPARNIKLSYVCGNTFLVTNANTTQVAVTWEVHRTTERGSLTLPAKPADAAFSETRFTTVAVGTVRLLLNGKRIATADNLRTSCETPPPPPPPPPGNSPGRWDAPFAWPQVAVHLHLLPTGTHVLSFTSDANATEVTTTGTGEHAGHVEHAAQPVPTGDSRILAQALIPNAYLWTVGTTGQFTPVPNYVSDMFCAGHTFDGLGRLLVAGGHIADNYGLNHTNLFDANSGSWTRVADMTRGRWYPTVTALANGGALVLAGQTEVNTSNTVPEVWNGSSWSQLTGASLTLPLYPWAFAAPDGRVFVAGPQRATRFLSLSGAGVWSSSISALYASTRSYGSAVMYAPGRILIAGGGDPPTATAETIDLTGTPAWQPTGAMAFARRQLNLTILADGSVLATGGTSSGGFNTATGAVLAAERWDPATGLWTTLASAAVKRFYHSTALLLPDGTVLSAGSGRPSPTGETDQLNAEIFHPPYLLMSDGSPRPRPSVSVAPGQIAYGSSFTLTTNDNAAVARVTLVRLSSVTHAFNQSQRFAELAVTRPNGVLTIAAPTSANLVPPGPYLLFVLDANGTPSVGRVVRVQ